MQRKIKVTMPKSKKQLEHTHTFIDENLSGHTHIYFHHRESIISDLRSKEIKFTILPKNDLCFLRSKLDRKSINTQYC